MKREEAELLKQVIDNLGSGDSRFAGYLSQCLRKYQLAPPHTERLVGIIPKYFNPDTIENISLHNGSTLLCHAYDTRDLKAYAVLGKDKFGPWDEIAQQTLWDGKLLYSARVDKEWFVVWGDDKCGPYQSVECLQSTDSGPLYIAQQENTWFVFWGWGDSESRSQHYDEVSGLIFENDRCLFCAKYDGKEFVLCCKARDFYLPYKTYQHVKDPQLAKEAPLYAAYDGKHWFVVWGDDGYKKYDSVQGRISIVDNKPLYCAWRNGRSFVVWGHKEYKDHGFVADHLRIVGGEPLYSVSEDCHSWSVVWGDKEYMQYDMIEEIAGVIDIDNEPVYSARQGDKVFLVWGERRESFKGICNLSVLLNKPLYLAMRNDNKWQVVWGDRKSKAYDEIVEPLEVNDGVLGFGARKGRKIYCVTMKLV